MLLLQYNSKPNMQVNQKSQYCLVKHVHLRTYMKLMYVA